MYGEGVQHFPLVRHGEVDFVSGWISLCVAYVFAFGGHGVTGLTLVSVDGNVRMMHMSES